MTINFVIVGNSGSGKSTLAAWLCRHRGVAALDLDTIAWKAKSPPERVSPNETEKALDGFVAQHPSWVIEGCYGEIVTASLRFQPKLVFLDSPVETCLEHCRRRPFEPHKFENPEAQAKQLEFLLKWVAEYPQRTGDLGRKAHQALFEGYEGPKLRYAEPLSELELEGL